MGLAIKDGSKNVTTAGTRVQLTTTTGTYCHWVVVTARPANTGKIVVGGAAVVATAGSEVGAPILSAGDSCGLEINDLSKVWIDSTVNGEGVSFTYGV